MSPMSTFQSSLPREVVGEDALRSRSRRRPACRRSPASATRSCRACAGRRRPVPRRRRAPSAPRRCRAPAPSPCRCASCRRRASRGARTARPAWPDPPAAGGSAAWRRAATRLRSPSSETRGCPRRWATSGRARRSAVFHATLVAGLQVDGSAASSETPWPCGPRNCGQFPAWTVDAEGERGQRSGDGVS